MSQNSKYWVEMDADMEELVPKILEIKRQQAEEVSQASEERDFSRIKAIGHKIRGMHGIQQINDLGTAIENAAMDEKLQEIWKFNAELLDFLDHIEIHFK